MMLSTALGGKAQQVEQDIIRATRPHHSPACKRQFQPLFCIFFAYFLAVA